MNHVHFMINLLGLSLALSPSMASPAESKTQTLTVGTPLARFSLLKPATRIYLRYKIVDGRRETMDLWRREVSFEQRNGQRQLHIFWRWDSVGERKFSRTEDFWFEADTFRPLTVVRRLDKDGKITLRGYRYLPDRIEGLADLVNNDARDFVQPAAMPAYNWEADMEFLQTLPLSADYKVRIPFYEAGPERDAPPYYQYNVVGEEKITASDSRVVDCWIVSIASTDSNWGSTRFWFAKESQIMLREETQLKDGTIFVKMLLPYDSGDEQKWNAQ